MFKLFSIFIKNINNHLNLLIIKKLRLIYTKHAVNGQMSLHIRSYVIESQPKPQKRKSEMWFFYAIISKNIY